MENDSSIFQNPQGIWALVNKVLRLVKECDQGYLTYMVDGREYAAIFHHDSKWDNDVQGILDNRIRRNITIYVRGLFKFRATYYTVDKGHRSQYNIKDFVTSEFHSPKLTYGMWAIFVPGLRANVEHHMMMLIMSGENDDHELP